MDNFIKIILRGLQIQNFSFLSLGTGKILQILKCKKEQTRILQTRIWICYIFHDFYAIDRKLSEIEEWTVTFVMNRKKLCLGVETLSCHLKCVFFSPKFYRDSGSISQKRLFFFLQKPYIIGNLHLFTYQIWKNILGHIK